jgi:cytochrome c oxidase cbb3-type subunit 3
MRVGVACMLIWVLLAGCGREQRQVRLDPPSAAALAELRLMPNAIGGTPPEIYFALDETYDSNAYSLSQGKRLYTWFGCASCHGADGGGGIGPSFLDGWWLYGPEMVSVAASIMDGRPHGIPGQDDRRTDLATRRLCPQRRRLFGENRRARPQ